MSLLPKQVLLDGFITVQGGGVYVSTGNVDTRIFPFVFLFVFGLYACDLN